MQFTEENKSPDTDGVLGWFLAHDGKKSVFSPQESGPGRTARDMDGVGDKTRLSGWAGITLGGLGNINNRRNKQGLWRGGENVRMEL